MPLLLHIGTPRYGVPGNEFTINSSDMTVAGRSTTDYWVRYSLGAMLFAGAFDRYPRLKVGSVEHETMWIPHWLQQMDFTYRERPVFTKGWKSREGMLPSDYWKRRVHGRRPRRADPRRNRGRQYALGQRFPAFRIDLAAVKTISRSDLRRCPGSGPAQDHLRKCGAALRLPAELARRPEQASYPRQAKEAIRRECAHAPNRSNATCSRAIGPCAALRKSPRTCHPALCAALLRLQRSAARRAG